jgi:hypothetical protein
MADDDTDRIDPRYDAAFQRGYSGDAAEVARGTAPASALAPTPAPVRRVAPVVPPAAEPAGTVMPVDGSGASGGQPARIEPVPPSPQSAAVPGAQPAVAARPAAEPASPWEPTRNPFYLAAAALAVLLVVAGAVWLDQGFAAIADKRWATDVGYYAAMTMSFGAPLLIAIGVAILGALLFVLARAWHPRGGEEHHRR